MSRVVLDMYEGMEGATSIVVYLRWPVPAQVSSQPVRTPAQTMATRMLHPQRRSWWSVGPGARAGTSIVVPSCPRARALASRSLAAR